MLIWGGEYTDEGCTVAKIPSYDLEKGTAGNFAVPFSVYTYILELIVMGSMYMRVKLPYNQEDYIQGKGEDVWVKVEPFVKGSYERNKTLCFGIMDSSSLHYPLKYGDIVCFEMRVKSRPVVPLDFLNDIQGL